MGFLGLNPEEQRALVLSTFAGLSTTIGAIFAVSITSGPEPWAGIALERNGSHLTPTVAQVIKRPDDALLAFLLGTAIGKPAKSSLGAGSAA